MHSAFISMAEGKSIRFQSASALLSANMVGTDNNISKKTFETEKTQIPANQTGRINWPKYHNTLSNQQL